MNPTVQIESATERDVPAIKELLRQSDLPWEDVELFIADFLVARRAGKIIGAVGLEVRGTGALLRSLVVAVPSRGTGLGKKLYREILGRAKSRGVRHLGLLTMTAEGFFAKAGFHKQDKEQAPEFVRTSREYRELCPASAVYMGMDLR